MSAELERSTGVTNPLVLIQSAIDRGLDPDKLGKLMDLQERWEHNRAAEQFATAIAAFQQECPPIFKGRQADRYAFANYDDVMRVAGPIMSKHGIVVSFSIDHSQENLLVITCRIRVGGYFEDHSFPSPVAAGVKLSAPQEYGMTIKYLQRYALCASLNIVTSDIADNDGAGGFITTEQMAQLNTLLVDTGSDLKRFLKWANIENLEQMTAKDLPKAVDMLQRKQKKAGAA